VLYDALTPEAASTALAALGQRVAPAAVEVVRRDEKWMARLAGGLLAWFAATPSGLAALGIERRVLRALAARCRFAAPRLLAESPDGAVDVRVSVPGAHDTYAVCDQLRAHPAAAARVGATLGALVAEWHTHVGAADVAAGVPHRPSWPEPRAWVRDRLPRVVADPALHAAADAVMAGYEAALDATPEGDRALVHTDLGLHNISIDVGTLEVYGVFDWETACWADRHLDFRYFTFDLPHDALLDAALTAYEAAARRPLSRPRIYLYNAACAVGYLAFRDGVPPNAVWCGRTLAEDLHWARHAIARVAATHADR